MAKKCNENTNILYNQFLRTLLNLESVKIMLNKFNLKDEHIDFCNRVFSIYINCDEKNNCNNIITDIYSFNILKNNLDVHIIDFYKYLNNLYILFNTFNNIKINDGDSNIILNPIDILA